MYEVIKTIQPPVLVAMGERKQLKRFLVCTGGKEFIEQAVQFTGQIASALGASVTLLHVMAEPPAIYVDLVQLEENVDQLLESKSELGINLLRQKKELEHLAVPAEVRLRHGIVIDEVFEEVRTGDYDVIVTGTSQARGLLGHYIMGDLTRSILNRADCPVLVARAGKPKATRTLWKAVKGVFAAHWEQPNNVGLCWLPALIFNHTHVRDSAEKREHERGWIRQNSPLCTAAGCDVG
jgi:nucleotide-binding universal stress UspA family protein